MGSSFNSGSEGRRSGQANSARIASACSAPDFSVRTNDQAQGLHEAQSLSSPASPQPPALCPQATLPLSRSPHTSGAWWGPLGDGPGGEGLTGDL